MTMKFIRNSNFENARNSAKFHCQKYRGIPWNFAEFHVLHQKFHIPPEAKNHFRGHPIHELINCKDTKQKFFHLKKLICKGTLWQVFIRVYKKEIQLVWSTSSPSPLSPFSVWISILYAIVLGACGLFVTQISAVAGVPAVPDVLADVGVPACPCFSGVPGVALLAPSIGILPVASVPSVAGVPIVPCLRGW